MTVSGSDNGNPLQFLCSIVNVNSLSVGDLVLVLIKHSTETSAELLILKKIKCPQNYVFGVYFNEQKNSKVALFSNKGNTPIGVLPLKCGETIDRRFGYFELGKTSKFPKRHKIYDFHIFGSIDCPSSYSKIAAIEWSLREAFPKKIINEAKKIFENYKISKNEYRIAKPFITIDPDDAKDLDDAIFIEEDTSENNPGGLYLYIAIADVSFFVKSESIIDEEALKRGNSTYFPDKVIPMLPEDLSNSLCSLKERTPKKAIVVEIKLDYKGRKLKHRFMRGLITVKKNYSYEKFEVYLSQNKTENKFIEYKKAFDILQRSPLLNNRLNLNLAEKKITISEGGYPIDLYEKKSLRSNYLIEMMMILANLCVSETLTQAAIKYISREHKSPEKHALKELNIFMRHNDLLEIKEKQVTSRSFNQLIKRCRDPKKKKLVSKFVLRILPKAKYSEKDNGHFGLNLPIYCHFTSPIRRYADLTVHRSLALALKWEVGKPSVEQDQKVICQAINESEKKSVGAERDSVDRYSALFISNHINEYFDGVIVGSSRFCIFIKLNKFPVEGVLLKKDLKRPEGKRRFISNHNKNKLELYTGRSIRVKVASTQPFNGSINFSV
ncbi:ribonuclease R [Paracoccaceae bacterium]|nr:ribonuclease R [Paracoccaceae bacterium]